MKKLLLLLLLAIPLFLLSCDKKDDWRDDVKAMTVTVASQPRMTTMAPFFAPPFEGLAVKFSEKGEWKILSGIGAFVYEEGYEYTLRVERRRYDPELQDVGGYYYTLLKVISKSRKDSEGLPRDRWNESVTIGSRMTRMISLTGENVDAFYVKFDKIGTPKWEKIEAFRIAGFEGYEEGYEYEIRLNSEKLWDRVGMDGVYCMEYSFNGLIRKTEGESVDLPE